MLSGISGVRSEAMEKGGSGRVDKMEEVAMSEAL